KLPRPRGVRAAAVRPNPAVWSRVAGSTPSPAFSAARRSATSPPHGGGEVGATGRSAGVVGGAEAHASPPPRGGEVAVAALPPGGGGGLSHTPQCGTTVLRLAIASPPP